MKKSYQALELSIVAIAIAEHEVDRAEMQRIVTKIAVLGADGYDDKEYITALAALSTSADRVHQLLTADADRPA